MQFNIAPNRFNCIRISINSVISYKMQKYWITQAFWILIVRHFEVALPDAELMRGMLFLAVVDTCFLPFRFNFQSLLLNSEQHKIFLLSHYPSSDSCFMYAEKSSITALRISFISSYSVYPYSSIWNLAG